MSTPATCLATTPGCTGPPNSGWPRWPACSSTTAPTSNIRNHDGNTPLHWAAGEGQKELVVILIVHGADVNARGKGAWTPLRWAEAQSQKEIARILIASGARR